MIENQKNIPEWMKTTEEYVPLEDRDSFLKKTEKQICKLLAKIKAQTARQRKFEISAGLGLFALFLTVMLTVLAKNLSFVFLLLCAMLILTAFYDAKGIRAILAETVTGITFAILFTLPAALCGNLLAMQTIVLKTAVTVMAVALLNHTLRWNQICASISRIKFLDTFLFVFDLMIHDLVILGRICAQLLEAMKLRSIGKNRDKKKGMGGILGVTYLKSRQMADETYCAMQCRGFDGSYYYYTKHKRTLWDVLLGILCVLEVFCYIRLAQ
ncbi:MAG: energy-coupling factor transporter transmembrane component T [Lachnospiraceae bacterium]